MGKAGHNVCLSLWKWVDVIMLSSGSFMVIGFIVGFTLIASATSTKKWPVAPESDIAQQVGVVVEGVLLIFVCI